LDYLSSGQLTELLRIPGMVDPVAVRLAKYVRFAEPLNNLILLLLVLPFILSRQRNLKASAALAVLFGMSFFAFIYIARYIGLGDFLGAFLPVLLFGPTAVLMLDSIKT
jgi:lipopolysaccharide export LptBFGC system permease protein LptF